MPKTTKMHIYLVGGAVRDQLLGRPVKDRDWVVTGATPELMVQLGYTPVGKDFPVFLHPDTHEEYALARTERKTAKGYHGFQFHTDASVTVEQDLARRDLTINAIAQTEYGELVDPFHGQADLTHKILRHVSDAFAEDPVRILRVARFAARYAELGFTIAPETLQLMRDMVVAGEVDALVAERVWQEMEDALGENHPERFFEVLRECGALKVIFPALDQLFGVPQAATHHPEIDTGIHTLMVLQAASRLTADKAIRFAALVHDLGKGATPAECLPKHPNHEAVGVDLVQAWCEQYRVPSHFAQLAQLVTAYHGHIHKCLNLSAAEVVELILKLDGLRRPERFEQCLLACQADSQGRLGYETNPYPQRLFMQQALIACQQVSVPAIIAAGFKGAEIKPQLQQHYQQAVARLMTTT